MKVFALGGYGTVAFPAIQLLAQSDLVTQIAIVGRSLERPEKAATEIGEKAIAVQADGTDEQELRSLLAGYHIIVNAASENTVLPAVRAAIHTGGHYCDVASFGDFAQQPLQLAPEAEDAGITGIVAVGMSPCISNLMGVYVARQLDEVEQLQLGRADIVDLGNGRAYPLDTGRQARRRALPRCTRSEGPLAGCWGSCRKTAFGQRWCIGTEGGVRWIRSKTEWTCPSCRAAQSPHTHL
ncbi:MAG: saccharopine dehydrogenase NADP-binding domain-containing protein [Anaerolineae bacterium]|nr:saccharopine dehydrogenase NADP-binding domain-containing protein [Anaerolineae bacterium]